MHSLETAVGCYALLRYRELENEKFLCVCVCVLNGPKSVRVMNPYAVITFCINTLKLVGCLELTMHD